MYAARSVSRTVVVATGSGTERPKPRRRLTVVVSGVIVVSVYGVSVEKSWNVLLPICWRPGGCAGSMCVVIRRYASGY